MSYRAIKLEEGKYLSLLPGESAVTAADFEKPEYIPPNKFLSENLQLSETDMTELNAIIGRFLAIIQEASFVHRSVMAVVPPDRAPWLEEDPVYPHPPLPYGSTLSPQALTEAIRGNIADVIRDVISLVSGAKTAADASDTPVKKAGGLNGTLIFTVGIPHSDDFTHTDLLTNEARLLLEAQGPAFANALQEILRNFAEAVLVRSDLSFASLRNDITFLERKIKGEKPHYSHNAEYSTLNPYDLTDMAQRFMPNVPAAILMRLPEEQQEHILRETAGKSTAK